MVGQPSGYFRVLPENFCEVLMLDGRTRDYILRRVRSDSLNSASRITYNQCHTIYARPISHSICTHNFLPRLTLAVLQIVFQSFNDEFGEQFINQLTHLNKNDNPASNL